MKYGLSLGVALYHEWMNQFVGSTGWACVCTEKQIREYLNDDQWKRFLLGRQIRIMLPRTKTLGGCQLRFRKADSYLRRKRAMKRIPKKRINDVRRVSRKLGAHTDDRILIKVTNGEKP